MNQHRFAILLSIIIIPTNLLAQFAFYDSSNGIQWAQVTPPATVDLGHAQILREGLGYLLCSDGAIHEYDAARSQVWRRLPQPGPYTIRDYFALAPNDIWAVVEVPETYKTTLYHWNGKKWSPAFSGNARNIRTMVFPSPQEGWVGCEYGELWHYQHGQWRQEKSPLFIHIHKMTLMRDGALFVSFEAPGQNAVLRYHNGIWQAVCTDVLGLLHTPVLTPGRQLLIPSDAAPIVQRILSAVLPAWQVPVTQMQLFQEGHGYGIRNKAIYAIRDTTLSPLVETPVELREVCLFNNRFSWIVGHERFLLAPQAQPVDAPPPPERALALRVSKMPDLYGLAVLQKRPGEFSHLYGVQTERPNVLLSAMVLDLSEIASYDEAPEFNLGGPTSYPVRRSEVGIPYTNYDQAVATGDLNGDGRDDVIVFSMYGHPFVYLNSGRNYYFDATAFSGLQNWGYVQQRPMLGNLLDADRDGDLDLFVACQYRSNAFFLNDGRGRFTEATAAAGLQTEGGGIGGFVADFDDDGWEDLYVTCVNRPNLVYRNLGVEAATGMVRFAEVCAESGDACWPEPKHSQGVALADYDNDGDCDIYVCNLAAGNRLLQNDGSGRFADVTVAVGLVNTDQSVGASFFDADNDGDLDLVVANRGRDRFYRNLEGQRFLEQSDFLGGDFATRDLLMFPSRQFGGSSSGTLAFDYDGDEALDVFISSFDDGLSFFKNNLRAPGTAIRIFPEGIVSNRSAVGVKVFLYQAGELGKAAALSGSRVIESASSYGCSPAKVAHFGVDSSAQYDAKIVFPSGIVREVHGLRGGDRLVVREIEGLTAEAIKARRSLADVFLGYRSRERYLLFALGACTLVLLLMAGGKFVGLPRRDQAKFALLFGASLFVVFLYWFTPSEMTFVLRPLALGSGITIAAILLLRMRRLYRGRVASMDLLHARLNAFEHGSMIRQLMDRLDFFAENLEPGGILSEEARPRLLEATNGLAHFLKHEIEAIRVYQDSNNFAMELAYRMDDTWVLLKRMLKRLRENLVREEYFDHDALLAAAKLQMQMRELVADFKKRVEQRYCTDVITSVKDFLRKLEHESVTMALPEALPYARIMPADLAYVLDELVQNALRHITGRQPHVVLHAQHALDEILLDVRDNGCGIAEQLWEQIFRPGFTTKRNAPGGFGLYHARQRLEKYGAKIFVAESAVNIGTTMRICLRVAQS